MQQDYFQIKLEIRFIWDAQYNGYFIQDEQIGLEHFLLSESWMTLKILPIFLMFLVHRKEYLKNYKKEKPWLVPLLHTLKQSES